MTELKEPHWETIQAKTFTKWVNDKLSKHGFNQISNLYEDFKDGVNLGNLLSVLLGIDLKFNKRPFTRIQKVENLEILLKQIKKQGLTLINIGPEDIVDGNKKLILGLIWTLISKLSIIDLGITDSSMRSELLRWCKEVTQNYKNVNIIDLSRSWQDGLGFNAIIHNFRPDLVPNYFDLKISEKHFNLGQAFDIAEKELNIPKFLDIEDVADVIRPDEKIMITYLSEYYKKFNQFEKETIYKNLVNSVLNRINFYQELQNNYTKAAERFIKNKDKFKSVNEDLKNNLKQTILLINKLQTMNDHLAKDSLDLHKIFSEISYVHKTYNFKKFEPPQEFNLKKLEQDFEFVKIESLKTLEKSITDVNCESDINEKINIFRKLCENDNSDKEFRNLYVNLQDKNYTILQEILKDKLQCYELIGEDIKKNEILLDKAILIFDRHYKNQISLEDLKKVINKLGLVVDDKIVEKLSDSSKIVDKQTYVEIIKIIINNQFNSENIKTAMKELNIDQVIIQQKEDNQNTTDMDVNYIHQKKTVDLNEICEKYLNK